MKFNKHVRLITSLLLLALIPSCASGQAAPVTTETPNQAIISLVQTQAALNLTVEAYQVQQTEAARATATPSPLPTAIPTQPATPGPTIIQDDFSMDVGRWIECGQCVIENGVMRMGPYPIAMDGGGYLAICRDCGTPQDYKMGVDATFVDGYTDRGFGLAVRERDGDYVDVEITTWQYYGAWVFIKDRNIWDYLLNDSWKPTPNLRPGVATNRLEIEVTSKGGKSTINIYINGQLVDSPTMDAVSGRVGLVVGLHSLGVVFDNFYFEGFTNIRPENNPVPSGPSG